jgi:hypothetical protein
VNADTYLTLVRGNVQITDDYRAANNRGWRTSTHVTEGALDRGDRRNESDACETAGRPAA